MQPKKILVLFFSLLLISGFLIYSLSVDTNTEEKPLDLFIGVDVAYENITAVHMAFNSEREVASSFRDTFS